MPSSIIDRQLFYHQSIINLLIDRNSITNVSYFYDIMENVIKWLSSIVSFLIVNKLVCLCLFEILKKQKKKLKGSILSLCLL